MKRVIALIIAAVVLAAGTGVASFYYLRQADDRAAAKYESVQVLQAVSGIAAGTTWGGAQGAGQFAAVNLPSMYVSAAMLRPTAAIDASYVAARDIAPGQLIMSGDFQATVATVQVLPIPAGHVALAMGADAAARLAPFLSVGDHVRIMGNAPTGGSRIAFDDLQVIAIGNSSLIGTGAGEAVPGLLTFAVPSDRAVEFVEMVKAGGIYLALLPQHSAAVTQ